MQLVALFACSLRDGLAWNSAQLASPPDWAQSQRAPRQHPDINPHIPGSPPGQASCPGWAGRGEAAGSRNAGLFRQVRRATPAHLPSEAAAARWLTRPDRRGGRRALLTANRRPPHRQPPLCPPPPLPPPTAAPTDITELDLNSSAAPRPPGYSAPHWRRRQPMAAPRRSPPPMARPPPPRPSPVAKGGKYSAARRGGLSGALCPAAPRRPGTGMGISPGAGWEDGVRNKRT